MNWKDLGLVWNTRGHPETASSHAMGPTPILINKDIIRVYLTSLDSKGIGRPIYIEVSSSDPTVVLNQCLTPILEVGEPGTFDDNGIMVTSVVKVDDHIFYMYYAGFELSSKIRYRILTGMAISTDGGITFTRFSDVPILERSNKELYFRGGPFVLKSGGIFRMWYVAGSSWTMISGKQMPVYVLKYLESKDGFTWPSEGTTVMEHDGIDEHGFGRPWVLDSASGDLEMHYSIRRVSLEAYRLGFATSSDGLNWVRHDESINLDVKARSHASTAIMYSAVINTGEKTYCFYNGDNFGQFGFAAAELVP
jgi:hypothetical protein